MGSVAEDVGNCNVMAATGSAELLCMRIGGVVVDFAVSSTRGEMKGPWFRTGLIVVRRGAPPGAGPGCWRAPVLLSILDWGLCV
jgi:hypothetical protein